MKFRITLMVIVGMLCLMADTLYAQCVPQRDNITSLSSSEQCELRNLMLDYLNSNINPNGSGVSKYPIVNGHVNPNFGNFGDFHNYAEEFATWHRNYVQEMEEYILARGYPQYVPLPYWTPHQQIPDAFYNYAGCNGTYANLPQNEGFPLYSNGNGPFAPSSNNSIDFSDFHQNFDCSDWIDVDDFVGSMEGPHHDQTHGAVGGTLGPATTAPASTLFWLFHAYITDLHSCYLRQCGGKSSDIYVRDNAPDDGSEPTIQNSQLWTSPDIWVRNDNDGFGNTTNQDLCYKENAQGQVMPVYVYVRTWNRGDVPSKNNNQDITVYWAQASAGLGWPSPWDGVPIPSVCNLPLGGMIGTQPLRSVNGQYLDQNDVDMDMNNTEVIEGYTIYEFEWFPPNPDPYINCFNAQLWHHRHFCVHARVDDGTPVTLTGNFYSDLANNNDLALKNIAIYGPDDNNQTCDNIQWNIAPPGGDDCLFFGNYTEEVMENVALRLHFPTDEDQELLQTNKIEIELKGTAIEKWMNGGKAGEMIEFNPEDGEIQMIENGAIIQNLTIEPMEVLRYCLEITGDPVHTIDKDYEFDIVQTVQGEEVGGQRYTVAQATPEEGEGNIGFNIGNDSPEGYLVYPNPAKNRFTVRMNNGKDSHYVRIFNSFGQIVVEYTNVIGKKVIDARNMESGVYFIHIKNQYTGQKINQKIIVE